eukprot:EG_transcript_25511
MASLRPPKRHDAHIRAEALAALQREHLQTLATPTSAPVLASVPRAPPPPPAGPALQSTHITPLSISIGSPPPATPGGTVQSRSEALRHYCRERQERLEGQFPPTSSPCSETLSAAYPLGLELSFPPPAGKPFVSSS